MDAQLITFIATAVSVIFSASLFLWKKVLKPTMKFVDEHEQVVDSINTIKKEITYILERLDYEDGSWDSIRYVKGGKIDKLRN